MTQSLVSDDAWKPTAIRAQVLYGVLLGVGLRRSTITYGEVAHLVGLKLRGQGDRATLGSLLDEVATYSRQEWDIVLPALVVAKSTNLPTGRTDPKDASGFYAWALADGLDISDPGTLVANEQRKVYDALAFRP